MNRRRRLVLLLVALIGVPSVAVGAGIAYFALRSPTGISLVISDLPSGIGGDVTISPVPSTGAAGGVRHFTRSATLALSPGQYRISSSPVHVDAGTYVLADATKPVTLPGDTFAVADPAFVVTVTSGHRVQASADYYDVIPDTTQLIPAGALTGVAGEVGSPQTISFTGTTFNGPKAANLAVGDIVMAGTGPLSPGGLLGKVASISRLGAVTTVQTSVTDVFHAFPRANISIQGNPYEQAAPGALQSSKASASGLISSSGGTLHVQLAGLSTLLQKLGVTCSGGFASVSGSISLSPNLNFSMEWGGWLGITLESATISASLTETGSVTLSAGLAGSCSKSVPLGPSIALPTLTIPVGPVPVILTPFVRFYLTMSIGTQGSITGGITQSLRVTAGASYTESSGFRPFASKSASWGLLPVQGCVQATGKVAVGPRLSMLLYGITGGNVNLDGTLGLTMSPLTNPWWTLSAGVQAGAGVEFHLFLYDYEKQWPSLVSFNRAIASSGRNKPPPIAVLPPSTYSGTVGQPFSTQLAVTPNAKPTIEWFQQSGELPPGITLTTDGLLSGTPAQTGQYVLTVTVKDGMFTKHVCGQKPRSASSQLTINISAPGGSTTTTATTTTTTGPGGSTTSNPYPSSTSSMPPSTSSTSPGGSGSSSPTTPPPPTTTTPLPPPTIITTCTPPPTSTTLAGYPGPTTSTLPCPTFVTQFIGTGVPGQTLPSESCGYVPGSTVTVSVNGVSAGSAVAGASTCVSLPVKILLANGVALGPVGSRAGVQVLRCEGCRGALGYALAAATGGATTVQVNGGTYAATLGTNNAMVVVGTGTNGAALTVTSTFGVALPGAGMAFTGANVASMIGVSVLFISVGWLLVLAGRTRRRKGRRERGRR